MSHFHGGSVSASSTELDTSGSVMFNQSNGSPKRHNEVNGKDDITDSMMPMKEGLYTREEEHDEHDGHHSYNSFINGKLCHIDSSNQDLDCIKRSKIDAESRSPKSHNNRIAEGKAHQEFIPVGRPEELLSPAFPQAHSIEESRIRSRSRSPLSRKANRDVCGICYSTHSINGCHIVS
eukprot:Lankesteria_metandrocarpae@DN5409_c0_g1_i1.p1